MTPFTCENLDEGAHPCYISSMRQDMSKVIVERPRRPSYDGSGARRGRRLDEDLLVSKEGMRAPHVRHWGGKELNENLAPLVRFLRSRVGQRWDAVYSEISQHLRATNAVQQHVRDHLDDFVATRVREVNGELWVSDYGFRPLAESWRTFYVDPRDGILRENRSYRSRMSRLREQREAERAQQAALVHVAKDGTEYRKVNGIWYQVEWETVPEPRVFQTINPITGEVGQKLVHSNRTDAFTGKIHNVAGQRYRSGRRQISRSDLRRLGLTNSPQQEA